MASSNKTKNVGLNDWSGNDRAKRTDFNNDNKAIDNFFSKIMDDLLTTGVVEGGKVKENTDTDLSVNVEALLAYGEGVRLYTNSERTVDCSEDVEGDSTEVETDGNEKWISLYVTKEEGDPVFEIYQGTEAAEGDAEKPDIEEGERVLLADILLSYGQTEIAENDISNSRKQEADFNAFDKDIVFNLVTGFHSKEKRKEYIPNFKKYEKNPIFTEADAALDTIYWPWVIRVDNILDSPLGKYYMYYSTDHDGGEGGIALAYADTPYGPWEDYSENPIYKDTEEGTQTETPSVVWNEDTQEFYLYYHNASAGNNQSTGMAKSIDGINWNRHGIVIDVEDNEGWPGDGHTGYFMPHKIHNLWVGYHLMGGGDTPHFGISYSNNGEDWETDPRPLRYQKNASGDDNYFLSWNHAQLFKWQGEFWVAVLKTDFTSGSNPKDAEIVVGRLSQDFRRIIPPVTTIIDEEEDWENTDIRAFSIYSEEEKLYLYYQMDDKVGLAVAGL